MTTVFAMPVFDATVIFEGNELFKGKGSAQMWAEKLATEISGGVTVQKIGTGWVLCGRVDGADCVWGIHGQRLKQVSAQISGQAVGQPSVQASTPATETASQKLSELLRAQMAEQLNEHMLEQASRTA